MLAGGGDVHPPTWRAHLQEIETTYEAAMASWIDPGRLTPSDTLIRDIARRLEELGLD
jgi:hypothetical protein